MHGMDNVEVLNSLVERFVLLRHHIAIIVVVIIIIIFLDTLFPHKTVLLWH